MIPLRHQTRNTACASENLRVRENTIISMNQALQRLCCCCYSKAWRVGAAAKTTASGTSSRQGYPHKPAP